MKPGRSRRWTRIPELRALLDQAVAEPGSKLVAVAVGPCGQEQTLQRWAATTVSDAHAWARGHLKTQAQAPAPAVRFRWVRPGGERAGSVVCRLELPRPEGEGRTSVPGARASAEATPDERSALRHQLAAAEARAEQAERARQDGLPAARSSPAGVAGHHEIQALQERISTLEAELRRANADCARLARERDTLDLQLQEAAEALARKDALLQDATRLAQMVSRTLDGIA